MRSSAVSMRQEHQRVDQQRTQTGPSLFQEARALGLCVALRCQLPAGLLACKCRTGAGFPVRVFMAPVTCGRRLSKSPSSGIARPDGPEMHGLERAARRLVASTLRPLAVWVGRCITTWLHQRRPLHAAALLDANGMRGGWRRFWGGAPATKQPGKSLEQVVRPAVIYAT